jgi:hypothetical protein
VHGERADLRAGVAGIAQFPRVAQVGVFGVLVLGVRGGLGAVHAAIITGRLHRRPTETAPDRVPIQVRRPLRWPGPDAG